MQQQDQQLYKMMQEQEVLKRELEEQRRERIEMEKRRHIEERARLNSRDKERGALNLLNAYELLSGSKKDGGLSDLLGSRKPTMGSSSRLGFQSVIGGYKGEPNYNDHSPLSSPFRQSASMIVSPTYTYGGYQQPPQQSFFSNPVQNTNQGASLFSDPNFVIKLLELVKEKPSDREEKSRRSKLSDMMMSSLERQNMVLSSLAQNIGRDQEDKMELENRLIEHKIRRLQGDSDNRSPSTTNSFRRFVSNKQSI